MYTGIIKEIKPSCQVLRVSCKRLHETLST